MRKISVSQITSKVSKLCTSAANELGDDIVHALREARKRELSPVAVEVLGQIIENSEIARSESVPMCQDTGISVFLVELGNEVCLDGLLEDAINEGVRQGYLKGYLRKSVCDPFTRRNTGDNTPAIVHIKIVKGDSLKISIAPKGGGSENMSRLAMLRPSDGADGIKRFVVETVRKAGGNPCPPVIVGVGIGGNFEKSAILAKESLFRSVGSRNPVDVLHAMETELLDTINSLGIGPMGFGGLATALAVHIKVHPCHIASLPVAVNMQCHAARHKEVII